MNLKSNRNFDILKFFLYGFQADSALFVEYIEKEEGEGFSDLLDAYITHSDKVKDIDVLSQFVEFLFVNMSIHLGHPEKYQIIA